MEGGGLGGKKARNCSFNGEGASAVKQSGLRTRKLAGSDGREVPAGAWVGVRGLVKLRGTSLHSLPPQALRRGGLPVTRPERPLPASSLAD